MTEELEKDLKVLKDKFKPEELNAVREDIIQLLTEESDKNRLTENQIYLYGYEVLRTLCKYYGEQVDKRYLIYPPKEWFLKDRDDKGIGG